MKKFIRPLILSSIACGLVLTLNSCERNEIKKEHDALEAKRAAEQKEREKQIDQNAPR